MTAPLTPVENLAAAEVRVQQARDQLHLTIAQLQARLDPRASAEKVVREARVVGETAAAIARDKPAAISGIVGGAVMVAGLFLGRHRIARLFATPRRDTPPATVGLAPVTRTDT